MNVAGPGESAEPLNADGDEHLTAVGVQLTANIEVLAEGQVRRSELRRCFS
jgi:hypothetical protein